MNMFISANVANCSVLHQINSQRGFYMRWSKWWSRRNLALLPTTVWANVMFLNITNSTQLCQKYSSLCCLLLQCAWQLRNAVARVRTNEWIWALAKASVSKILKLSQEKHQKKFDRLASVMVTIQVTLTMHDKENKFQRAITSKMLEHLQEMEAKAARNSGLRNQLKAKVMAMDRDRRNNL